MPIQNRARVTSKFLRAKRRGSVRGTEDPRSSRIKRLEDVSELQRHWEPEGSIVQRNSLVGQKQYEGVYHNLGGTSYCLCFRAHQSKRARNCFKKGSSEDVGVKGRLSICSGSDPTGQKGEIPKPEKPTGLRNYSCGVSNRKRRVKVLVAY